MLTVAPHPNPLPSSDAFVTAWALSVDRLTAEVTHALRRRGVDSILLKGPSIATWLYDDDSVRSYGDCDLLVASRQIPVAQEVLRELGFADMMTPLAHPRMESHDWRRGEDSVDLHSTLIGIHAHPDVVWNTLSVMTETARVGGAEVRVLSVPARALHVALHAAQHGRADQKPLEDLRRAIDAVQDETWFEVAAVAERLEATEALATGLRLLPAGATVASRLGLDFAASIESYLRVEDVPLALGFAHLKATQGFKARLLVVLRELFPTVAFMRWWAPLARRGPAGLIAAYCWRPLWLLARAVPGFWAWRRARRMSV